MTPGPHQRKNIPFSKISRSGLTISLEDIFVTWRWRQETCTLLHISIYFWNIKQSWIIDIGERGKRIGFAVPGQGDIRSGKHVVENENFSSGCKGTMSQDIWQFASSVFLFRVFRGHIGCIPWRLCHARTIVPAMQGMARDHVKYALALGSFRRCTLPASGRGNKNIDTILFSLLLLMSKYQEFISYWSQRHVLQDIRQSDNITKTLQHEWNQGIVTFAAILNKLLVKRYS